MRARSPRPWPARGRRPAGSAAPGSGGRGPLARRGRPRLADRSNRRGPATAGIPGRPEEEKEEDARGTLKGASPAHPCPLSRAASLVPGRGCRFPQGLGAPGAPLLPAERCPLRPCPRVSGGSAFGHVPQPRAAGGRTRWPRCPRLPRLNFASGFPLFCRKGSRQSQT